MHAQLLKPGDAVGVKGPKVTDAPGCGPVGRVKGVATNGRIRLEDGRLFTSVGILFGDTGSRIGGRTTLCFVEQAELVQKEKAATKAMRELDLVLEKTFRQYGRWGSFSGVLTVAEREAIIAAIHAVPLPEEVSDGPGV